MNNIFAGALSYADDITLLFPSICGINKMIDICCESAKEYDNNNNNNIIIYNICIAPYNTIL